MFSAIGYGSFFYRDKLEDILINFGFKGLVGFFVLIVYSYLSHFFIPHSFLHNTIILSLGIISFIFFQKKNLVISFFGF